VTGRVNNHYIFYGSTVDPSYSTNPYDAAGQMHNVFMSALAQPEMLNNSLAPAFYKSTVGNLLSAYDYDSTLFADSFDLINSEMYRLASYGDNYSSYYHSLTIRGDIIALHENYLQKLDSIIDSIPIVLSQVGGSMPATCLSMFSKIKALEDVIMADQDLSQTNARMVLLTATSIARHSIAYFAEVHINSGNSWRNYINPPVLPEGPTDPHPGVIDEDYWVIVGADWVKVTKADAAGSVGAVSACGMAAVFIEFTWPVIAGAVLGGSSGNSAVELYNQLVYGSAMLIWVCC
jgi:hypothetical protein